MLAFGKEGVLKKDQIVTVANYVRSLSGLSTSKGYDAAAGAKIFLPAAASYPAEVSRPDSDRT